MKLAAAHAIAGLLPEPVAHEIVPSVFDVRVVPAVSQAVAAVARQEGLARA